MDEDRKKDLKENWNKTKDSDSDTSEISFEVALGTWAPERKEFIRQRQLDCA